MTFFSCCFVKNQAFYNSMYFVLLLMHICITQPHNIAIYLLLLCQHQIAMLLIINLIMDSFMMDQVSISLDQCAWIEKGCEIMNDEDNALVTPHFHPFGYSSRQCTATSQLYPSPLSYPSSSKYLDIIMLSDVITFIF